MTSEEILLHIFYSGWASDLKGNQHHTPVYREIKVK